MLKQKHYSSLFFTLLFFQLNIPSVFANPSENPFGLWYLSDAASGWHFDLALGLEREPTYTGSKNYTSEPGFSPRAIYVSDSGRRYSVSLGEVGAYFPFGNNNLLALVLEYEPGRDNSADDILTGFPEVKDTVEGQLSLAKQWGNFTAGAVLQPDLQSNGKGLVYFLGIAYDKTFSNKVRTGFSLDISFADQEYFQTEIGVPSSVTESTGIATYTPSSGYKSSTLGFGIGYPFLPRWEIFANLDIEIYGSNMKDSPLIRDFGDGVNYETSLGVRYAF